MSEVLDRQAEASPLVRQFELLAGASGGVARLRELILSLAVRGKLVPQDPDDEPVDALLSSVKDLKERQRETFRTVRRNDQIQVSSRAVLVDLPAGWAWSSFADLCSIVGGSTPSKAVAGNWSGDIPWVSPKDMKVSVIHDAQDHVSEAALAGSLSLIPIGSLLVVVRGMILAHSFPVAETSAPVTINQDMKALTPVEPRLLSYLKLVCHGMRPEILRLVDRSTHGTCKLESSKLFGLPIPIPPLAEQSRIVARVDELMRLCDALEAKGRLEAAQHTRLLDTLLGTLTDSATPEELAVNWQRVAEHFDLLLDRPEAVDALERTVLQLAVRGLLVPQDPNDEPASVLLQHVRVEKERLFAVKNKRDKPGSPIADRDGSVELPQGWLSTFVGDVVEMLNGYAFKSEWFKPAGMRLLRNVNIAHGHVDWSTSAFIDSARAKEYEHFALDEGDLVLTLDRPIISTGLKFAVIRERDLPCLLLQRVARLTPVPRVLSREFLVLWMQSDAFLGALDPGRSNGVPHISTKQVASMPFQLPPIAEQSRIVARVTELRRHCADLRQRLAASQSTRAFLATALVEQVLA